MGFLWSKEYDLVSLATLANLYLIIQLLPEFSRVRFTCSSREFIFSVLLGLQLFLDGIQTHVFSSIRECKNSIGQRCGQGY